jgi:N-acyl homoserine lactone hydrolase
MDDAPRHELYLLHFGWLLEDHGGATVPVQVPGYLIRSATGKVYLIDSGNPAALVGAPDCRPWYGSRCDIRPEDDPVARLAELGLAVLDLDGVIATHFDFDHCGRMDAIVSAGVEVWVQRSHMGAALSAADRYPQDLWRQPGLRACLIDGDRQIEPGLRLLRTDGHCVGHQSIYVETTAGPVILTADAVENRIMLKRRRYPDSWDDTDAADRSVSRLLDLQAATGATLICGHDGAEWRTLPKSPAPFSASSHAGTELAQPLETNRTRPSS